MYKAIKIIIYITVMIVWVPVFILCSPIWFAIAFIMSDSWEDFKETSWEGFKTLIQLKPLSA